MIDPESPNFWLIDEESTTNLQRTHEMHFDVCHATNDVVVGLLFSTASYTIDAQIGIRWWDDGDPWLVVWNHGILWHSHHIGNVILPFDELHDFSRWLLHHQPDLCFCCLSNHFLFFLVQLILQWFWLELHWLSPSPGKEECDKAGSDSSNVRRLQLVVPMDPGQKERLASGVMEHEIFQVVYGS